jgi:hypothetical protein
MYTVLRIPFKRAEEAPSWLSKKKAGRKLDPIEAEEYYHYQFEKEHESLMAETNFEGVPSNAAVINAIRRYHVFKKSCLMSFFDC